jgi:disulfide bond formation protein DsbB
MALAAFLCVRLAVRTNRHVLRLFFLVVILMGLWGGWYADQQWQQMSQTMEVDLSTETDWISVISALAENGIKFFQGATAETP